VNYISAGPSTGEEHTFEGYDKKSYLVFASDWIFHDGPIEVGGVCPVVDGVESVTDRGQELRPLVPAARDGQHRKIVQKWLWSVIPDPGHLGQVIGSCGCLDRLIKGRGRKALAEHRQ
jgi:hypothetical protein